MTRSGPSGPAELGYGDRDELTLVERANQPSFHFRKKIQLPKIDRWILGTIKRDDGAVVYINGNEVARTNMPSTPITFDTLALRRIPDAEVWDTFEIPPRAVREGENTIAVSVHNESLGSSDISFDFELSRSRGQRQARIRL